MTEHLLCRLLINDAKRLLASGKREKGNQTVYTDIALEIDLAEVYFRNLDQGAHSLRFLRKPTQAYIYVFEEFLNEVHTFISFLVWRMTASMLGSRMRLIYRYIIEAVGRMFINCYAAFMPVFEKCFNTDPAMAREWGRLADRLKGLFPFISSPVDERYAHWSEWLGHEEELYS